MGRYTVVLLSKAIENLQQIRKSGSNSTKNKIDTLLEELKNDPRKGTGKPEKLRYSTGEYELWSRRVDKKNRMVYSIKENIVTVHVFSILGHYEDK